MTANTPRAGTRSVLPLIFIAATTAMLVVRVASAGSDPIALLRAGVGGASLVLLLAMRRSGFARAAAYAFGLECIGGIAVFALVDAPAIIGNFPAIVHAMSIVAPNGLR